MGAGCGIFFVAEVLSPSTARQDRFLKRRRYQEAGVLAYWIVDPDARLVEMWTPADAFPAVEHEQVAWRPAGAARTLVLPLGELFRPE